MRQVHQIVDHEPIVAFYMVIGAVKRPVTVRAGPEIRNEDRVCLLPIPDPNPHKSKSLDYWIRFRTDGLVGLFGWDRHLDSLPVAIDQQSVITTANAIALFDPH